MIRSKLIQISECIGVLPSLAIHLRDSDKKQGGGLNKETMLPPITHLAGLNDSCDSSIKNDSSENKEEIYQNHNADLINYVCDHLLITPSSILDFELFLYDLNVLHSIHYDYIGSSYWWFKEGFHYGKGP